MKKFITFISLAQLITLQVFGAEIRGEIVKLEDEKEVYVKDQDGKKNEYKVNDKTDYTQAGKKLQFSDLKKGMLVVLQVEGKKILQLEVK